MWKGASDRGANGEELDPFPHPAARRMSVHAQDLTAPLARP